MCLRRYSKGSEVGMMMAQLGSEGKPGCTWWNEAPPSGGGACTERRQEIPINGVSSTGLAVGGTVRRDQSCPHGHLGRFLRSSAEPAAGFAQTRGRVYAAGVGAGNELPGKVFQQ